MQEGEDESRYTGHERFFIMPIKLTFVPPPSDYLEHAYGVKSVCSTLVCL